jgi:hypothetical protein
MYRLPTLDIVMQCCLVTIIALKLCPQLQFFSHRLRAVKKNASLFFLILNFLQQRCFPSNKFTKCTLFAPPALLKIKECSPRRGQLLPRIGADHLWGSTRKNWPQLQTCRHADACLCCPCFFSCSVQ